MNRKSNILMAVLVIFAVVLFIANQSNGMVTGIPLPKIAAADIQRIAQPQATPVQQTQSQQVQVVEVQVQQQAANSQPTPQQNPGVLTADQVVLSNPQSQWSGPIPDSFSDMFDMEKLKELLIKDYAGTFIDLRVDDTYTFPGYGCKDNNAFTVRIKEITPDGALVAGLSAHDRYVSKGSGFTYEMWDCNTNMFQDWGSVMGVQKDPGSPAFVRLYLYSDLRYEDKYWIRPIRRQDVVTK